MIPRILAAAIVALLLVCAVAASRNERPLIVEAHPAGWQVPAANPDLLFAPCPLGPRNRPPFRSERKA